MKVLRVAGFASALLEANVALALADLHGAGEQVGKVMPPLGFSFIFLAEILVGVRGGASVAEEKRRKIWNELLLTAQSFREITRSKMWGVLSATVPDAIA